MIDYPAAIARALTEERAANQTAVGTGVMTRATYRERSSALDLLEGRLVRLLERAAYLDHLKVDDRVRHANDDAANVGTVTAVEPATAGDPPLVTVKWDDGYTFTYAADVLERVVAASPAPIVRTALLEPGFYVTDSYAATLTAAVVSGPHEDYAAAERDRVDRNIADDCAVVEIRPARPGQKD